MKGLKVHYSIITKKGLKIKSQKQTCVHHLQHLSPSQCKDQLVIPYLEMDDHMLPNDLSFPLCTHTRTYKTKQL
jgi:hypothetical protein